MNVQQNEQHQQTIGRYLVFIHGQDVAMYHTSLDSIRILKPAEALMLLEWLNQHREELAASLLAPAGTLPACIQLQAR